MKDPRTGLPMFLSDRRLDELYRRTSGGAVSFIDESYRNWAGRGRPFYSMTAVTFAVDQLDDVREAMTEIAGGRYWHTTEAFEAGERTAIARMGRYIARSSEWNVVTVETPVVAGDRGLGDARATCLAALAREVTRGQGANAVRLLVADRNRDEHLNRNDQRVLGRLRSLGEVDRQVALYHGRMRDEPVLWAADTVSWSAYRTLAVDDDRWIAPMRDMLTVIDARTGKALDMKQPQAAAATPGARQPVASQGRGEAVVASTPSIGDPAQTQPAPPATFTRGTRTLDDLVRQIAYGRAHGGATGYAQGNTPDAIGARLERLRADQQAASSEARRRPEPGTPSVRGPQA